MVKQAQWQERRSSDTLRLRRITPSLTVNDLQVSLAWYRDVLGFHVQETWEESGRLRGAAIVAGSQGMVLSQDDWTKGRDRVKGQGLALYLTTVQDIDELAGRIKARGGELTSEPKDMPWGPRAFSLVDPDGFHLTITSAEALR